MSFQYSPQAQKFGVSSFFVGLISGVSPLVVVIVSPLLGYFVRIFVHLYIGIQVTGISLFSFSLSLSLYLPPPCFSIDAQDWDQVHVGFRLVPSRGFLCPSQVRN